MDYVINPWMEGNIHKSSQERAVEQWEKLHHILKEYAIVDLVPPQKGWPDMVFTANAGLLLGKNVVLSRFLHKERQGRNLTSSSGLKTTATLFTNCLKIYHLRVRETHFWIGKDAGCGLDMVSEQS